MTLFNIAFILICILDVLLIIASVYITKWEKENGIAEEEDDE